jgi:mannitol/fructose-specific phosphotransferase system IIA component (Ntr-type)
MKFTDFVCFDAVIPQLEATNRDTVISELVLALDKAKKLANGSVNDLTKAVIKRENEASTGMGKGVAVPHVKHKSVKKVTAAIGQTAEGIDFSALDKKPVYSVILLISPIDNPDKHLEAMEYLFRNLQDEKFRKFMRQSETVDQIVDLLKEYDEKTLSS